MKNLVQMTIKNYLNHFPEEQERLSKLTDFINETGDKDIIDWNNFNGHLVSSGFVYSKKENKFLVIYHKDMNMYVYPGGHIDENDKDMEYTARREVQEETGIKDLENYVIDDNKLIPLDIDVHVIKKNERLNLPPHYHFDFRYLYFVDKVENVKIDEAESTDYKWVNLDEISNITNCEVVVNKLKKIVK